MRTWYEVSVYNYDTFGSKSDYSSSPSPTLRASLFRYSGDFVDGRLHGYGSVLDVVGQVWEGFWYEGEMDGEGRHSAPEIGECEGDWVKGELQGKGKIAYKG